MDTLQKVIFEFALRFELWSLVWGGTMDLLTSLEHALFEINDDLEVIKQLFYCSLFSSMILKNCLMITKCSNLFLQFLHDLSIFYL